MVGRVVNRDVLGGAAMAKSDALWIAANMSAWHGRHFLDVENRRRMMEFDGVLFVWNPDREVWEFAEEVR